MQATTENRDTDRMVYNWAFGQGLTPMSYDWRTDTWFMSDGEPYTTTIILKEAAQDENSSI